jgi:GNAT superfamily N-acetyltransferase
MAPEGSQSEVLTYHPVTSNRWDDLELLFGKQGATDGCWCMWWRTTRAQFERNRNVGNRKAFKALVDSGQVTGILAYREREPIGWCSIAPREQYGALERSPVLRRIDAHPVWSIVCLFVLLSEQRKGVAGGLVRAAVDYARSQGAQIIESYPRQQVSHEMAPGSIYMGVPALYEAAGFTTVAQPTEARRIMRLVL